MTRFLDDGPHRRSIPMWGKAPSADRAEPEKNALFAGSDGGGEHWAVHRFADRALQAYRRRTARLSAERHTKLATDLNSKIVALLPWADPAAPGSQDTGM